MILLLLDDEVWTKQFIIESQHTQEGKHFPELWKQLRRKGDDDYQKIASWRCGVELRKRVGKWQKTEEIAKACAMLLFPSF